MKYMVLAGVGSNRCIERASTPPPHLMKVASAFLGVRKLDACQLMIENLEESGPDIPENGRFDFEPYLRPSNISMSYVVPYEGVVSHKSFFCAQSNGSYEEVPSFL
jgi:hypothetical protein